MYCSIHPGMDGTAEVGAPLPDTAAPTTTATVDGDGTATATVNLSASDSASGVEYIDYAVNSTLPADGSKGAGVTRLTNTDGTDPFVRAFQFTTPGTYTVEYREGNREVAKTQSVTVAPPEAPNPGPGPNPTPLPGPFPPPPTPKTPKANVTATAAKGTVTVQRRASRATLGVRVRNTGTAASGEVRVCADLATKSARQRLSISGAKCRTVTVAAGKSRTVNVAVRIKPGRAARPRRCASG